MDYWIVEVQLFDRRLEKFIQSLDKASVAKLLRTIDLLEDFGGNLGMPHSKYLGRKLFELRVRGQREIRILYSFSKGSAVLLHGFIKTTRKIPKREMELAMQKLRLLDQ